MIKLWVTFVLLVGLVLSAQTHAATFVIVNKNSPGVGLNDVTPVAPVPGNSATTRGQQYLNVFKAGANYWGSKLKSSVPIRMEALMEALPCNASGGVLGSAGPLTVSGDFPNAPVGSTWYVGALADSLANQNLNTNANDLRARFNSSLNGNPNCIGGYSWWLGINSPAPAGTISLYDTVLHEIGHGIGFLTLVNQSGQRFNNYDDAFMRQLYDVSSNKFWRNMTNSQRAASGTNNGRLVWRGNNVNAAVNRLNSGVRNGYARMYAPSSYQQGSSVSHWDTALSPDELMEPSATYTSDDCLTMMALKDSGWKIANGCSSGGPNNPNTDFSIAPILPVLLDEEE